MPPPLVLSGLRTCTACGHDRPAVTDFEPDGRSPDGLRVICKACSPPRRRRSMTPDGLAKICPGRDCPAKGVPQPLGRFARNASRPSGLGVYCLDCHNRGNRRARETQRPGTETESLFGETPAAVRETKVRLDETPTLPAAPSAHRPIGLCENCGEREVRETPTMGRTIVSATWYAYECPPGSGRWQKMRLCSGCVAGVRGFRDDPGRMMKMAARLLGQGDTRRAVEFRRGPAPEDPNA